MLRNLRQAATSLAACWFSLCGFAAAIPIEPTVYDLLVSTPQGIKQVQVKTTTYKGKAGWQVGVGRRPYSIGNREPLVPYDPELIYWFFIVDGDLTVISTSFPVRSSADGLASCYVPIGSTLSAAPPDS